MWPKTKSPLSPEEYTHLRGQYPILDTLARYGTPLTRENYVRVNWNGEADENDAEFEAQLPPPFRTW